MEIVHFLSNVSGHSASTERPAPRRPSRSKAAPKDIESLISNNLMKLRSLSPSSKAAKATDEGSNLIYDRLDVSGPFWVKHWEGNGYFITYISLRNKSIELNEMFQRNTSKFYVQLYK